MGHSSFPELFLHIINYYKTKIGSYIVFDCFLMQTSSYQFDPSLSKLKNYVYTRR